MTVAGIIAAALLAILTAFQLALAAGAPLGAAAWGGQHPGVLPTPTRIASAVAGVAIYPLLAAVVLGAAGIIGAGWLPFDRVILMWILAGFFGLGTLVNAISRSPVERIWSPVSAVLAICCVVIALG